MNPNNDLKHLIPLTELSHGGGCGCKMSSQILSKALAELKFEDPSGGKILVGNSGHDDAAVYDLGQGQGLISTTDFFMPIVDNAYDFGRIAATNAISDVYAMGGKPILALAIMALPINKVGPQVFKEIMQGALAVCKDAGVALAGGHSIDSVEPIFGLAVNGLVKVEDIRTNMQAKPGDYLVLTKPLGVGVLAHSIKKKLASEQQVQTLVKSTTMLNKAGSALSAIKGVHALTDVTGFGLLGHAFNIARGSRVDLQINYNALPLHEGVKDLLAQGCLPGGTVRNWEAHSGHLEWQGNWPADEQQNAQNIVCDPQTSGGLLFSVAEEDLEKTIKICQDVGIFKACVIGRVLAAQGAAGFEKIRLSLK